MRQVHEYIGEGVDMAEWKLTIKTVSGWGVLFGLVRIGLVVFIGFNAPWFVTVLAVLLQVQLKGEK